METALKAPTTVPRSHSAPPESDNPWRAEFLGAALCGACALTAALLRESPASLPLYVISYLAGGWFAAQDVWALLKERRLDVHFLMLLVAAGSASVGGWGEGATLLFLFSISGAMENYAAGRTEREISALFKTSPKTARLMRDGHEESVPVEAVVPGMRLLIKPGDLIPVDCEIAVGKTACDESTLTGEAVPVDKSPGAQILAGTLNLWGAVEATVLRPASQSALSRIIEIIREAQHLKAPAQQFTDRFSGWYTYSVLALSAAMFFVWWLALDLPPLKSAGERSAFYRSMTLLVVASPCALVLSIPSAILSAIAAGARRGILFRGGSAVERLAATTLVAMDKTGTITTGELRVESIETNPPGRELEAASLAYSLEVLSTHPLARAIATHGKRSNALLLPVASFESLPGAGLRAMVDGQLVRLGKRSWTLDGAVAPFAEAQAAPGHSEVWLRRQDGFAARFLLRDDIRENARELVADLHRSGLRTLLLTGDQPAAGELARQIVGIQEVQSSLRPEDKLRVITALKRRGERVAMVGDGVNDAPSLAAADVGVAMGARGSDAALEQADVELMHDKLENFLEALRLSQRARSIIHQNLIISLGTVLVLVVLALRGSIPLTLGVVGHEGSTVLVVLNSLRLLIRSKPGTGSSAG